LSSQGTSQEAVLTELREMIGAGKLEPGQQIVQESLSAALGVSRVPIREALRVLEGEGQVIHYPNRGYFVADLSVEDLEEVYRIRAILEEEALRLAIPLLTDSDIEYIESIQIELEKAVASKKISGITETNRRFHFAMFEASNMPRLVRIIRTLWDATDAYRGVYFAAPANLQHMNTEHRQMLESLRKRDVKKTIEHQTLHRENAVSAVSQVIRPKK
jgi:DNA-binding GntR family transcriptional regulator